MLCILNSSELTRQATAKEYLNMTQNKLGYKSKKNHDTIQKPPIAFKARKRI
jgi:hypothetical protein